jgi:LysR family transcriptional regulator, carnitine catabolism transcriptional activator
MEFSSRQLRAFLLVAQHRSFSRAAEALYITPSGLSVLIREFESQLGFRLFHRTTRHVGLTTHGSQLLGVVRHSMGKLDSTVSRVRRMVTDASMSLNIGAPPLIAANVLPEAIKEFRSHRPDIHIQVFDVGGDALTKMVETGKLDMSLGGFFTPTAGIRRKPLFRFSLMVIRPDNDPTLRRTSTTWSALKGERLISLTPGQLVQQFIDKHLARNRVVLHPCAVFNYLDTQIAMVEAGEGVAIIPSFVLPAC